MGKKEGDEWMGCHYCNRVSLICDRNSSAAVLVVKIVLLVIFWGDSSYGGKQFPG